MRRPSFCLDVRFDLSKLTSQLRKGEIAGVFLLACNFTDAMLLGFNSLGFLGKGLTGIGLFLKVPTVKRPCDGTSGLVRGNRRKAVFAFKGLFFGKDFFALSCLERLVLSHLPEVCGKFRNPRAHRLYRTKKPQVDALELLGVVDLS